jgi:hypothetical protein
LVNTTADHVIYGDDIDLPFALTDIKAEAVRLFRFALSKDAEGTVPKFPGKLLAMLLCHPGTRDKHPQVG